MSAEETRKALALRLARLEELRRREALYRQMLEVHQTLLLEILQTKSAVEQLKKTEGEVSGYINIGSGIFVQGTLDPKEKLLVDVGASVAVPMSPEDAARVLDSKEKKLREAMAEIRRALEEVQRAIINISNEIEMLRRHLEKSQTKRS